MQINHAGDAMLAILQDSSTTSSSEEKPYRQPVYSGATESSSTDLPTSIIPATDSRTPSPAKILHKSRPVTAVTRRNIPHDRVISAPNTLTPLITETAADDYNHNGINDDDDYTIRDLSPVIVRDTINTGSTNRYIE